MTANHTLKAINPECPDGPKTDIIIPGDLAAWYYTYEHVRFENLRAAKYVLENTTLNSFWHSCV